MSPNRGDYNSAIQTLMKAIEIEPSEIIIQNNLLKLTLPSNNYNSLWNYWWSSTSKKIFTIFLSSLIGILLITSLIIPHIQYYQLQMQANTPPLISKINETLSNISSITIPNGVINYPIDSNSNSIIENLIKNSTTGKISTTKLVQTSSIDTLIKQPEIPVYNLIALGLIILVLLAPIIRSAKLGVGTVELTTIDFSPSGKYELSIIER